MRFYKINRIEFNYEAPIFLMNKEIPQCAPPKRFACLPIPSVLSDRSGIIECGKEREDKFSNTELAQDVSTLCLTTCLQLSQSFILITIYKCTTMFNEC